MKIVIDTTAKTLTCEADGTSRQIDLYSKEAFELISDQWLTIGWNEKYPYTFSWMGRPIIQLPEDLVRIQEVIYRVRPDVILETGVAHGGSLILYASLCKAMGHGRVIGIDIEIRPHNRKAIEAHELSSMITLIEGSSVAPEIVQQAHELIKPEETTLVILDSNHSKEHVAAELKAYADLITPGSYIVATDGSMKDLSEVPRGNRDWVWDNPAAAAAAFAETHPDFELEQPAWPFNESTLEKNITHWPG
ncbi:MAG: hydroxylase, partial [Acidobacteria bacterium]